MKLRSISFAAAILATATALAGCGTINDGTTHPAATGSTKEVKKILFDYPFTALPVYAAVVKHAQEEAAKQHVTLELTNDNMDLTQQVTNLTTYLNKDLDAVVSFPADAASLENLSRQYINSGKYWVSYANSMSTQSALLGLSAHQSGLALGEHAGKWITDNLGGTGKVLIVSDTTMRFSSERTQGMVDGLKASAPNAVIVSQQAGVTPQQGLSVTTSVLSQYPDLNVVLTTAGDAAQGAYQALTTAGRDPKDPRTYVGGLDGNAYGLQRMQEGAFFRAQVTLSAADIGKAIVDIPISLGKGDTNAGIEVPITLLSADTPDLAKYISEFSG
ncbi:sugar ABC transporter substrate-binding protein [Arthrobacter sp. M4]|uniref:sugar ABC transporter substrate-binding protein n=1 Tax=Arthrobacter sp. M4 TaxID=218160 RepID=UPI001CDC00C6|nr:sugar ABC transporter substrate-binding protein [Arthrobacter sp. M4]MCA4132555.1 sugar ABC transporter substrate-binding protein [Arthrobacter sp. M4]